jgi:hypothetical protein
MTQQSPACDELSRGTRRRRRRRIRKCVNPAERVKREGGNGEVIKTVAVLTKARERETSFLPLFSFLLFIVLLLLILCNSNDFSVNA